MLPQPETCPHALPLGCFCWQPASPLLLPRGVAIAMRRSVSSDMPLVLTRKGVPPLLTAQRLRRAPGR